ncbi:lasso peptide biosynthesis B2 protein [Rubrivivax gelatinosus]|uniref:lasso peptide biosynthesis B2 protein n=1 Tax=Rubrivivax gelatinosus TaxID=28068 RepID=UPI0019080C4E|nr:lasso peptide biosynthesis B2 protein [Rubrivivax gelatinosus]
MKRHLRRLAGFARLGAAERGWFVLGWLLLGLGRAAVQLVAFKRLAPWLGQAAAPQRPLPLAADVQARAQRIGRLLRLASRHTPWGSNCFAQALAARWLLGLAGVPCSVCFGLRRDAAGAPLQAHAWVAAGSVAVCGGDGFAHFTPVGCFVSRRSQAPADSFLLRRLQLLRLLANKAPEPLPAPDAEDWSEIQRLAQQHRLEPLLHWQTTRQPAAFVVPPAIATAWAQSFRAHAMRSLAWQGDLVAVQRVLQARGIPAVFLKGAFLATQSYPHAALRPLRDLDVLVPPAQAMAAFDALAEAGFTRLSTSSGDPQAYHDQNKHLPPLLAPRGRSSVEVHRRLYVPEHGPAGRFEPSDDPGLWQRLVRRDLAGETIAFLSPTDLLLHLAIHALFDHRLDNGPLVLSDLAFLLQRETVDWPLFWQLAERGGYTTGCWQLLLLAERAHGPLPLLPPTPAAAGALAPEFVALAATLMLGELEQRGNVRLGAVVEGAGFGARLHLAAQRFFPPRRRLASIYPVAEDSPWILAWYPRHWWRLLTVRLPAYLAQRRGGPFRRTAAARARLDAWLAR